MPICSPFSSITRISRARILSLMRINCFAERLSSAMVPLQGFKYRCGGVLLGRRLALRVYHWLDAACLIADSPAHRLFQVLRRFGINPHPVPTGNPCHGEFLMLIALYGATGASGSRILTELLSRGHQVTA